MRDTRKVQRISQEQLAGVVNTGVRFVSDLENGKPTVQLDFYLTQPVAEALSYTMPLRAEPYQGGGVITAGAEGNAAGCPIGICMIVYPR